MDNQYMDIPAVLRSGKNICMVAKTAHRLHEMAYGVALIAKEMGLEVKGDGMNHMVVGETRMTFRTAAQSNEGYDGVYYQ